MFHPIASSFASTVASHFTDTMSKVSPALDLLAGAKAGAQPRSAALVDGAILATELMPAGRFAALKPAYEAGRGDAELSMVELQSQVAKRGTVLQQVTGMLGAMNESNRVIAGNIGGSGGKSEESSDETRKKRNP